MAQHGLRADSGMRAVVGLCAHRYARPGEGEGATGRQSGIYGRDRRLRPASGIRAGDACDL